MPDLLRNEIATWRSFVLWVLRRKPGEGDGAEGFAYARELTPLLLAFVVVSAIEVLVVHLLVPWPAVQLVLLVLGVWGVLWMLGFLCGVRTYRHVIDGEGLRIRYSHRVDVRIPWEAIEKVGPQRAGCPSSKPFVLEPADDGDVLVVPALKQTRVLVTLREPTTVRLPGGPAEVVAVRFYVDDQRGFVDRARRRMPATA